MTRIALGIEYNGKDFLGWQTQPNRKGIQDALENALKIIAQEEIHTITAGRTDTGVHALEQIVHFDTTANRPLSAWIRGVNSHLPKSVRILWAKHVSENFHARFGAIARTYEYRLYNHAIRPALFDGLVGWFHTPLDVELMQKASEFLIGTHDFSAFRASECQAKSPIRTIEYIKIYKKEEHLIIFELKANAFLHHMVRNIIGSLIYVGKGKHKPDWVQTLLDAKSRKNSAPTFMSDGLYFKKAHFLEF